jgi:hypothetical protein
MKKIIFTITAGLFLLVSCSKDEINNGGNNGSGGTGKYTCDEVYEKMETIVDRSHYDGIIDSLDPNRRKQVRLKYEAAIEYYRFHGANCFAQGSHEFKNFDEFLIYHLEMDSIMTVTQERLDLAKKEVERKEYVKYCNNFIDSFYKRHSVYHFDLYR